MFFNYLHTLWLNILTELCRQWNTPSTYSSKEYIVFTVFCTIEVIVFFTCAWAIQYGAILEYGFPKKRAKSIRKKMKKYTPIQRFLIFPIIKDVEKSGLFLFICLFCHGLTLSSLATCIAAYVILFIKGFVELPLTILFEVPFKSLIITVALRFIPDLIWLPSEQRRYGIKPKKR